MRRAAKTVLRRWQNMRLAPAFSGWSEHAATKRRMGLAADKIVRRWINMALTPGMSRWMGYLEEKRRLERATLHAHRLMKQLGRNAVHRAFVMWLVLMRQMDVEQTKQVHRTHMERVFDVSGPLFRLRRCILLSWIFGVWLKYIRLALQKQSIERHVRRVFARIDCLWDHCLVDMMFCEWMDTWQKEKQARSEEEVRKRLRLGAAVKLDMQELTAFTRRQKIVLRQVWTVLYRGCERKHALEICWAKQGRNAVVAALRRWHFAIVKQTRLAFVTSKIVRRERYQALTDAVDGWRQRVLECKWLLRMAGNVLSRLQRIRVVRGLAHWLECHEQARQMLQASNDIHRRRQQRIIAVSWLLWHRLLLTIKNNVTTARKIVVRWRTMQCVGFFARWSTQVARFKCQRAVLGGMIGKISKYMLGGVFNQWRAQVDHLETIRSTLIIKMQNILLRMKTGKMAAALRRWEELVFFQNRVQRLFDSVCKWAHVAVIKKAQTMRSVWCAWSSWMLRMSTLLERRGTEEQVRKIFQRIERMWDRSNLAAVVSHWSDFCQHSKNVKFEDRAKAQDSLAIARLQDVHFSVVAQVCRKSRSLLPLHLVFFLSTLGLL